MKTLNEELVALRLCSALLIQHGEIGLDEIKTLPFISDNFDVQTVVLFLQKFFGAELVSTKVASRPIALWEQRIRLRKDIPPAVVRKIGEMLRATYPPGYAKSLTSSHYLPLFEVNQV